MGLTKGHRMVLRGLPPPSVESRAACWLGAGLCVLASRKAAGRLSWGGRTRLDRPFTAEEAKELDARNRERLTVGRTGRFDPCLSGTEQEARSKRSKSSMRSRAG